MKNTTFKVLVNNLARQDKRFQEFGTFASAYHYYMEKCADLGIEPEQITTAKHDGRKYIIPEGAEMELSSGGRGYDYRVELLIEENED